MARTSNPLIGASSGSIGGVTLTTWKGINVAKAKPTSVANPKTDAQKERRSALSQTVAIYRDVVSAVNAGFKSLAVKMAAYNAFTSYNLKNAFSYTGVAVAVYTLADFLFSRGTIDNTPITTMAAADGDETLTITFPTTVEGSGQSASDKAIIVCYNEDADEWSGGLTTAMRSAGTASIEMKSAATEADTIHCYLGFTSADGVSQSDSQYDSTTASA